MLWPLTSSSTAMKAFRLRGGRQDGALARLVPYARGGKVVPWPCRCPTRAAARGDRAPCTPGQGLRPLEP
jgi:hypothetical protein